MSVLEAVILGAVQGLTEFLPVSSSGHLVLFRKILGVSAPALFFDTLVHGGTLIAVFVVLRSDIWAILRRPVQPLSAYLVLGTLPAVIAALAFKDAIEAAFESGAFLGFAFLATSVFLALAEILSKRAARLRRGEEMTWLDSLIIGVFQAIAIVPGLSRSGSTLSASLARGLDRDFAARFSFLLSIPAILGALVLQIKDVAGSNGTAGEEISGIGTFGGSAPWAEAAGAGILPMAAGTLTAALVGFFAITIMLKLVRERSLWGFSAYTGLLGLLVLADQRLAHLFF
ncbi:MAG: undecaprenyl-diphosphate phosphatase [Treponema sp.]|jgi:undecaprenyl-diphosphatase|nr:undecaprenyl-diphosphate phosphatase [Treponema sp.]